MLGKTDAVIAERELYDKDEDDEKIGLTSRIFASFRKEISKLKTFTTKIENVTLTWDKNKTKNR